MKLVRCVFILAFLSLILAEENYHEEPLEVAITGNKNDLPEIQMKNGLTIVGRIDKTEANTDYFSFRGIPYAEPPLGELRFKPPVPLSSTYSNKTIYAQDDGSPCTQIEESLLFGSEDCLYINVYTPQLSELQLLPVMVWIHGGTFLTEDSTYERYGPDYFMDERQVMIVTFNYRLGIFGFLRTQDDASPGNYGLKDQILALKWVKENIRSFGGNPDLVTIFGQSAGAASATYLAQTPLTKGLFHRVIAESGTSLSSWAFVKNPKIGTFAIARVLNITATNSKNLVDSLRKINSTELILLQENLLLLTPLLNNILDSFPFGAVVEPPHPEAVIVTTSYGQLTQGLFQNVPFILGYNAVEGIEPLDALNYFISKFGIPSLVPGSMRIYDSVIFNQTNDEIISHYFGHNFLNLTQENIIEYLSDIFVRPIIETASLYSKQEPPVYLYKFSYEGYIASDNRTYKGATHFEELPYIWKMRSYPRNPTESDLITRKRMLKLWINFAKTGNPTPVTDSVLQNVQWPRTTNAGQGNLAYLDIGENLVTGVNPNWDQYQWWKSLFDKYGNSPYSTY